MTPNIRIDQEVYDYLNARGNTEDSFNDVLRRELGLSEQSKRKAITINQEPITPTPEEDRSLKEGLGEIIASMNEYLPSEWSGSPSREEQILKVTLAYLTQTPRDLTVDDRQKMAARIVAGEFGVTVETVQDKCGRQLFGNGTGVIDRFRACLIRIEEDLIDRKKILKG